MNRTQIRQFQRSFLQLMPDGDQLTDLFFARLFQLDPALRGLFPNDLRQQKVGLMRTLALVARSLEFPEQWEPLLRQLGKRHAQYGVTPRDYETFGTALLWTVETGMGEDFTPKLRAAWSAFYAQVAAAMQGSPRQPGATEHSGSTSVPNFRGWEDKLLSLANSSNLKEQPK